MINKVLIKAYCCKNLGDDLFIHILVNRYPKTDFMMYISPKYRETLPDSVSIIGSVLLRAAAKIEDKITKIIATEKDKNNKVTWLQRKLKLRELEYAQKAICNVYIIGSGFMEHPGYLENEYKYDMEYFQKNVFLIGCNFGPYTTQKYLDSHQILFSKAKDVCFRDSYSKELFKDLKNVRNEMDVVFTYELGEKRVLGNDFGEYILISVVAVDKDFNATKNYNTDYLIFMKETVEYCINVKKCKVVLVGFCKQQKDDVIINEICNLLDEEDKKMVYSFNYPDIGIKEIMGLFKEAKEVIASRYHAMIIAMLYQKKVYTISYSDKTKNVLYDIDSNAKFVSVSDLKNISIDDFFQNYYYKISAERLSEVKQSAQKQFCKLDEFMKNRINNHE